MSEQWWERDEGATATRAPRLGYGAAPAVAPAPAAPRPATRPAPMSDAGPTRVGAPAPRYERAAAPAAAAVVVLAVATLIALLVGLLLWNLGAPPDTAADETTTTASVPDELLPPPEPPPGQTGSPLPLPTIPETTTPPAEADASLLARIEELSDFVALHRSLEWVTPVEVAVLDELTFQARLLGTIEARREHLEDLRDVWGTVGILPPDFDLVGVLGLIALTTTTVHYDAETNVLWLRGADLDAWREREAVGALTMALVDQHLELHHPEYDADPSEISFGFEALRNGDAERIALLWEQAASSRDYDTIQSERARVEEELFGLGAPPALYTSMFISRNLGSLLVDDLVFDDPPRLDEAYADPPTTSEQVIDPDRYEARELAVEVEPPPVDGGGELYDEGLFGELWLNLMLEPVVGSDRAFEAADGWGGDWFVAWRTDELRCVRADVVGEESIEADELEGALLEWGENLGAEIERLDDETVRFTVCIASGGAADSIA
jgi:hypothetical protein